MNEISRESVVEAAKAAAAQHNGVLSLAEFVRATGISKDRLFRLFPVEGWLEVQRLAGIERHPKHKESLSDDELLAEYHRVASSLQAIPTWYQIDALASVSSTAMKKRFGGTQQGVLGRYRDWLEANDPDSPFLPSLQTKSKHEVPTPISLQPRDSGVVPTEWTKGKGLEYGAPINFRGLRHAPINEQGVVYLFGMVSSELGLIVEAVQSAFPDCEAKRCIDSRRNRWQRVRIEFEYVSSNFREHCHDPDKCDIIVCWEHDWDDCPLEVIELRTVIDRLEG